MQDEFRISRRLEVTAGVRYEPYSVPGEVNGLLAALPDPLHDAQTTTGIGLFRNPSKANLARGWRWPGTCSAPAGLYSARARDCFTTC